MHYYQFNIGDYRKDTIHLSRIEHSIYRDLIDWYYLEESPIPKETQVVIRRLRLGSDSDISSLNNVLNDFFSMLDDGFHHCRIDKEIADYQAQCESNRTNGKKGGRPKAKKTQVVSSGLPEVSQVEPEANPNHEPLTKNHKPDIQKVQPPEGVSISVWADFLKYRRALKAPVTDTAIAGFKREADKAGISLEKALVTTIENNWRGFKADWLKDKPSDNNKFAGAI
jgi:uncharacterized protein YdaU (DUF1376 family)